MKGKRDFRADVTGAIGFPKPILITKLNQPGRLILKVHGHLSLNKTILMGQDDLETLLSFAATKGIHILESSFGTQNHES